MTEWISVNDRLSELTVKAIWYNEHGDTIVGTYTKLGWVFSYYSGVPTHRKPIPELPKGEDGCQCKQWIKADICPECKERLREYLAKAVDIKEVAYGGTSIRWLDDEGKKDG